MSRGKYVTSTDMEGGNKVRCRGNRVNIGDIDEMVSSKIVCKYVCKCFTLLHFKGLPLSKSAVFIEDYVNITKCLKILAKLLTFSNLIATFLTIQWKKRILKFVTRFFQSCQFSKYSGNKTIIACCSTCQINHIFKRQ